MKQIFLIAFVLWAFFPVMKVQAETCTDLVQQVSKWQSENSDEIRVLRGILTGGLVNFKPLMRWTELTEVQVLAALKNLKKAELITVTGLDGIDGIDAIYAAPLPSKQSIFRSLH